MRVDERTAQALNENLKENNKSAVRIKLDGFG
jgi:hypothetical protein